MRSGVPEDQGQLFGAQIANPGAGNPVYIYADPGQRWQIDAIGLIFTTSAAIANRQVYISYYTGALPLAGSLLSILVITAGQTIPCQFTHWFSGQPFNNLGWNMFPLRLKTVIDSTSGLVITADNIQNGDTFTDIKVRGQRWIDG